MFREQNWHDEGKSGKENKGGSVDPVAVLDLLKHCEGLARFMRTMEQFLTNFNKFVNTYELLPSIKAQDEFGIGCMSKMEELKSLIESIPELRRQDVPLYEGNLVETIDRVEKLYKDIINEIDQLQADYEQLIENYYFQHIFNKSNSIDGVIFQKVKAIDTLREKKEEITQVYYYSQ